MSEPSFEEIADGMALWQEHKPQSGEDWVAVAERFIADGCTTENSSPLFAAVVLAVRQRDQLRQQVEKLLGAVVAHQAGHPLGENDHALYQAADQVRKELEG